MKIFQALIVLLLLFSCNQNKSYKYIEIIEEQSISGKKVGTKEKEAVEIKVENDSIAYLEAYEDFCVSLATDIYMKNTSSMYLSKTIDFKLINEQGIDISKTVDFKNKSSLTENIKKATFNLPTIKMLNESIEYEILEIKPYESSNKAQINVRAYITDDFKSKDELKNTAIKIKNNTINEVKFKNYSQATSFALFLYPGKATAERQGMWLLKYAKAPVDLIYEFSYNDKMIEAQRIKKEKSEDDIAFDKFNEKLSNKNTSICEIYNIDYDLENIRKADKKYPNFGIKHSEYVSELNKKDKNKIFKKYNINKDDYVKITAFGMLYCK